MKNDLNHKGEHAGKARTHAVRIQPSIKKVRAGWRESAKAISMDGDDLLLAEFINIDDQELDW